MLLVLKARRNKYGGYNYLEIDTENKVYATGCSAAHAGHGHGQAIEVFVSTQKELKDTEHYYVSQWFEKVDNMRNYQIEKER